MVKHMICLVCFVCVPIISPLHVQFFNTSYRFLPDIHLTMLISMLSLSSLAFIRILEHVLYNCINSFVILCTCKGCQPLLTALLQHQISDNRLVSLLVDSVSLFVNSVSLCCQLVRFCYCQCKGSEVYIYLSL